jgi:aspartate carbamoyltransferase catalytic subunit
MPAAVWTHRHLLGLDELSREEIHFLLDRSQHYLPLTQGEAGNSDELAGKVVANLFFEDSTRTRVGFTIAAQRLGATTFDLTGTGSSISKGETLTDTALNLEAMGVDAMVIRSSASGAAAMIANAVQCPIINAGDGNHEHPTQGLLDLMTIRQRLGPDIAGRTVAIVGDINNSRVARSCIHALTKFDVNVLLIGPPTLVPSSLQQIARGSGGEESVPRGQGSEERKQRGGLASSLKSQSSSSGSISLGHDLDAILPQVDAIMMLRVQFERGSGISPDYRDHFALTVERAKRLKRDCIIMHPGPLNRGLELDGAVADDPQRSVILQQAANGVAVRMAVLATLLGA